jgi:hypothetical protein
VDLVGPRQGSDFLDHMVAQLLSKRFTGRQPGLKGHEG